MINTIRKKISAIDGITLKKINLNFGVENIIVIEIKDVRDFLKWDYFCERLSRKCDSVHMIKDYPILKFKLPLDNEGLKTGLQGLNNALDCEYYKINRPKENHMTIIAKVTNLCNLDCQYCYDKPFRDKLGHNGFLSLEKLDHAIDMATKYAEEVTLLWHGGEPSLAGINYYKHIYEDILTKYPYADFQIDMQTNGTLIDKKWCDFCKEYGFQLGSSYNATQEDLRQNYSANGAETTLIQNAFKNIKYAIDCGVSGGVIDVFTKENHSRVKEIYEFYKREGVEACFNEIDEAGEAEKHQFLFITKEDKEKYREVAVDYFTYWLNDKDERCFLDRYASEYTQILMTGQSFVCHNGNHCLFHWVGLNSNGDLYPCDRALEEKYRIGNVMDFNSFEEVYNSPKYQNYAAERNHKLNTRCAYCDIHDYCHGNCPMIDIDANNDASKASVYACQMQRLNIECIYEALFNTTIDSCNVYVRNFLIRNCVFLPKEIPTLLEKLNISDKFKEYDFNSEDAKSLKSKEFDLFSTMNAPDTRGWISKNFNDFYDSLGDKTPIEDNRFEVAVSELKTRAEILKEKLKETEH